MLSAEKKLKNTGHQYLPRLGKSNKSLSPNQEIFPLTTKVNSEDHLEIGGCDVTDLVERFRSPLYLVDEETLRVACRQYREAFSKYYPGEALPIYASKAWNCLAICSIVESEGFGLDVVSGGELYTALQAGISSKKIYLHGNNKSPAELQLAIDNRCTIVIDNWLELQTLAEMTSDNMSGMLTKPVPVMVRLTPGIECHTHEYIRTGHLDNKFGFDPNELEEVFKFIVGQKTLDCLGLHAHIGSQIFELQPHQDLAQILVEWFLKGKEHGLNLRQLNIGGGLGVRYTPDDDPPSIYEWVETAAGAITRACEAKKIPLPKLIAEPGRSLIATACVTAYTVGSSKDIPGMRTYISVDGGMSDNPRPITYQSDYLAVVANRMSASHHKEVTIAGKHCESGDILIKDIPLPELKAGDILAVMGTGAYNYSMASNYNRVPKPAAVLINQGEANLIIRRETYQDLISHDYLPERLVQQRAINR